MELVNPSAVAGTTLLSSDGAAHELTIEVLSMSPTLGHLLDGAATTFTNSLGGSQFVVKDNSVIVYREMGARKPHQGRTVARLELEGPDHKVVVLPEIPDAVLTRVIHYCHFFCAAVTNPDPRTVEDYESTYLRPQSESDHALLCGLASAAYYLDCLPLVNLTSRAIASHISGKSILELREAFGLWDQPLPDLESIRPPAYSTSESALEMRSRLQRRLEEKAVQGQQKSKAAPQQSIYIEDSRPISELLSFIDGGESSSTSKEPGKAASKKKKNKGRKKSSGSSADDASANRTHDGPSEFTPPVTPTADRGTAQPDDDDSHLAQQAAESQSTAPSPPGLAVELPQEVTQHLALSLEQRRQKALQILANAERVQWAGDEDGDEDSEFDSELEKFRRRLEAQSV